MALTLTSTISATDRVIAVTGMVPDDIEAGYEFRLDDERLVLTTFALHEVQYPGWTQQDPNRNSWMVRRGVAVSHSAGAAVKAAVDAFVSADDDDPPPTPFASSAGGAGVDVLEDPGNVWEAATVVAEGYRIKNTYADDDHVFEATTSGTTADWASSFDELEPKYGPSALTTGDDVPWRHMGIVGRLADVVLPGSRPSIRVAAAGDVTVVSPLPIGGQPLFALMGTDAGVPFAVLEVAIDGDSDWSFYESSAQGLRWTNKNDDGTSTGPFTEVTINGFLVSDGAGDFLQVTYDPFTLMVVGLPSTDPEVVGQVYTDGVPAAGVPQALMVSGGPP